MLDVVILGIIQGIAEFLPISSSAHLIIFRELFNIGSNIGNNVELSFDLALHFGTLLAIIIYFFKELWQILINGLFNSKKEDGKLFWYLILATIPAAEMQIRSGENGLLCEANPESIARSIEHLYLHREEMERYVRTLKENSLEKQNDEIMDSLYRLFDGK